MNDRLERARRLLREHPLVDGHNDLPSQLMRRAGGRLGELDLHDATALDPPLHTDLDRLAAGGVGGQFFAAFVPPDTPEPESLRVAIEQIDLVHRLVEAHPERLELALSADDVERIHAAGRLAVLIAVEGGHAIAGSLAVLRQLYRLGVRYLTLTHNANVAWADSATDAPRLGGLSRFGVEVVREMNRLGMMVDLSHVAPATLRAAARASSAPVILSHVGARALVDFARNVADEDLSLVAATGGLAMATFVPGFVSPPVLEHLARRHGEEQRLAVRHPGDPQRAATELASWEATSPSPDATLEQVADHVDHLRSLLGANAVGIGSDFDGIRSTPRGLDGVDRFPHLLAELFARGYGDDEVAKIAGGNLLRVMRAVEAEGERLRAARPPSERSIGELDGEPAERG